MRCNRGAYVKVSCGATGDKGSPALAVCFTPPAPVQRCSRSSRSATPRAVPGGGRVGGSSRFGLAAATPLVYSVSPRFSVSLSFVALAFPTCSTACAHATTLCLPLPLSAPRPPPTHAFLTICPLTFVMGTPIRYLLSARASACVQPLSPPAPQDAQGWVFSKEACDGKTCGAAPLLWRVAGLTPQACKQRCEGTPIGLFSKSAKETNKKRVRGCRGAGFVGFVRHAHRIVRGVRRSKQSRRARHPPGIGRCVVIARYGGVQLHRVRRRGHGRRTNKSGRVGRNGAIVLISLARLHARPMGVQSYVQMSEQKRFFGLAALSSMLDGIVSRASAKGASRSSPTPLASAGHSPG